MLSPGRALSVDTGSENRATVLLNRLLRGEVGAADEAVPLVYDELRELADRHMARQPREHTLQPTALVNEAWMRLVQSFEGGEAGAVACRRQFFAMASKAMRSVLVDHARARRADKRGGDRRGATLVTADGALEGPGLDVLALDEALGRLEERDPELARIVVLRFFGGLAHPEVAEVTGVPLRTVERRWRLARAWLHRELTR